MGGGGLDWIGLLLSSFREDHPGVTHPTSSWAHDSDMRTAPLCPGTRSGCPLTTLVSHAGTVSPQGYQTWCPTHPCRISLPPHGPQTVPYTRKARSHLTTRAQSRHPTHSARAQELVPHTHITACTHPHPASLARATR